MNSTVLKGESCSQGIKFQFRIWRKLDSDNTIILSSHPPTQHKIQKSQKLLIISSQNTKYKVPSESLVGSLFFSCFVCLRCVIELCRDSAAPRHSNPAQINNAQRNLGAAQLRSGLDTQYQLCHTKPCHTLLVGWDWYKISKKRKKNIFQFLL